MNKYTAMTDPFGHWLAGFIDGEGCFFAGINNNGSPVLSLTVALRADDGAILYECQERTGLGKVYERHPPSYIKKGQSPQTKWEVFNKADCEELVRLLRKYPLRAKKARDFNLWAQLVEERAKWRTGRGAAATNGWDHWNDLMHQLERRKGLRLMALEQIRSNVPLTEEFMEHAWTNYDSFEVETKKYLGTQRHVDLRSFLPGEEWTTGTYGYLAAHAHFPGIELHVKGTVESQSAVPSKPVNLLAGFEDGDHVTFALPNFPLKVVNTHQSRLEITSDSQGHCSNAAKTAVVHFDASLTPLVEGHSQFSIERSVLQQNEIDLSKITGIRFTIVCNGAEEGTVTIIGPKLILIAREGNEGWKLSTVDFDNWTGSLRKPNPLNGDTTTGPFLNQGILWKANELPGYNDPRPVDAEFGLVFSPGSQEKINEVTLYMRQEPLIFQTQLDLIGVTQAELDGHPQPDLGTEEFAPRFVGEFDDHPMSEFDHLETMEDLERLSVENPVEESWVFFQIKWGEGKTKVQMSNSIEPGYLFSKIEDLKDNQEYLLTASVEDDRARVRIYELEPDKSVVQKPIFDSTLIEDDAIFRRRQGRFGWKAVLGDADAYVNSIRPRHVVFAEYLSVPLKSFTPVDGAQLFASYSGNEELWDKGLTVTPEGATGIMLTRDQNRTLSGESFRVDSNGTERNVGITTDFMEFIDFEQTEIKFFLWFAGLPRTVEKIVDKHPPTLPYYRRFPSSAAWNPKKPLAGGMYPSGGFTSIDEVQVPNIVAQLVSDEGTVIPLPMPELETNQWQEIIIRIPKEEIIQTGKYMFQLLQPTLITSSWWVDNISIFERVVQWSARSVISDPWNSNYAPFTDFGDIVNVNRKGILLAPRGNELQLRARALRQNATIKKPEIRPRYASLGRLVWPEEELHGLTPPHAHYKIKGTEPKTFKFTDESTPGTGAIVYREWSFGDGSIAVGNTTVEHFYTEPGEYFPTLIVIDRNGERSQFESKIEVF